MIADKGSSKRVISVEAGYCNPSRSRNVNTLNTASNGRTMIFHLFPTRQMLLIGYLSIFALSLQGCFPRRSPQMIERNVFENTLKVGQVLPLRKLVNIPASHVCVLCPYQDHVPENFTESSRINDYLRSSKYMGDEGHWSLLIVEPNKISISRFARSERLDILPFSKIHLVSRAKLPNNFLQPLYCALSAAAAVAKIVADEKFENRIYLIFGEMK